MAAEASNVVERRGISGFSAKCVSPDYKFPEALQRTPRCLIALSGLDTTNNAIHRLVWDEFSSGIKRVDRKPILFKNFPANHIYPKCGEDVSMLPSLWSLCSAY